MSVRQSLKQYANGRGYNVVSVVRKNSNDYKYVTLADKFTGDSENLYLGVRFAEEVEVGDKLDLSAMWVAETTNAAGEIRFKLTDRSGEISAAKLADYQEI